MHLQYYTFNQTLKQPSTLSFISSDEGKKKRVNIRACQVKKSIFPCCPSQGTVSFLYEIFVGGNSKDTFLMSIRRCVWEVSVYFLDIPANLFSQQTFSMKTSRDKSYYSRVSYRWQFSFPSHFVFKLLKCFFFFFFFWLRYVLNHCNMIIPLSIHPKFCCDSIVKDLFNRPTIHWKFNIQILSKFLSKFLQFDSKAEKLKKQNATDQFTIMAWRFVQNVFKKLFQLPWFVAFLYINFFIFLYINNLY